MKKNLVRNLRLSGLANENGMTLIEIMIVIAIIGGLLTVLGTTAFDRYEKSRVDTTKISMKTLSSGLEAYNLACNSYPTTDQGLAALVTKPSGDACPNWGPGAYVNKGQLKDSWGKDFIYESDGGTFEIKSYGRDKKEGGEGYAKDILSSEQQ